MQHFSRRVFDLFVSFRFFSPLFLHVFFSSLFSPCRPLLWQSTWRWMPTDESLGTIRWKTPAERERREEERTDASNETVTLDNDDRHFTVHCFFLLFSLSRVSIEWNQVEQRNTLEIWVCMRMHREADCSVDTNQTCRCNFCFTWNIQCHFEWVLSAEEKMSAFDHREQSFFFQHSVFSCLFFFIYRSHPACVCFSSELASVALASDKSHLQQKWDAPWCNSQSAERERVNLRGAGAVKQSSERKRKRKKEKIHSCFLRTIVCKCPWPCEWESKWERNVSSLGQAEWSGDAVTWKRQWKRVSTGKTKAREREKEEGKSITILLCQ